MRSTLLSRLMFGLLLFCGGGVLLASEADELRERATAMRKESLLLAEQGNMDEAKRLKQESVMLLEAAERLESKVEGPGKDGDRAGIEKEVRHMKQRLQDLLAQEKKLQAAKASEKELAEVREQIAGTDRELHALHARRGREGELPPDFRPQVEKLEAASRRIHHLRVAAENLKLAEAHDLAQQIMEKAEGMEREVQQAKQQLAAEMHKLHDGEHGPDVIRELRAEIERLRAEVKELRQNAEKR